MYEREREPYGHVILLGSIKYPNSFELNTILTTCWIQIKTQILTHKKNLISKPHLCIVWYIQFYLTIQCIQYSPLNNVVL